MKKFYTIGLLICGLMLLTGCTLEGLRGSLEDANQGLEQNDTSDLGDMNQYLENNNTLLDLSGLDLENIPDLCALLPQEIQQSIRGINLARNNIQIVAADLSCLENLTGVDISFNNVTTLLGLGDLPYLKDLRLTQNNIEDLSEVFFARYPTLQSLRLSYNNLREVSALEDLTNLVDLQLQHNEIISLVGIENLEKIQKLRLEFNSLKEDQLTYLEGLQNLEQITGGYNNFKQELLDRLKKASN